MNIKVLTCPKKSEIASIVSIKGKKSTRNDKEEIMTEEPIGLVMADLFIQAGKLWSRQGVPQIKFIINLFINDCL